MTEEPTQQNPSFEQRLELLELHDELTAARLELMQLRAAGVAPRANPVWDYISTVVPQASALTATSNVITDVATLSVPAGDWIIEGELWFRVTAGTPTVNSIATTISPNATASPTDPADNAGIHRIEPQQAKQAGTTVGNVLPVVGVHANVSATTLYYLTANIVWTGTATILLYGKITGRSQTVATTQAPPAYTSGRWIQRAGDIYPRYTYEGTSARDGLDPWVRKSPPATE